MATEVKIKALRNFGHGNANVEAGTVITVNPDDFGGTYEDFIDCGLFEVITEPAEPTPAPAAKTTKKPVSASVTIQESDGTTETEAIPVADIPAS